MNVGKMRDKLRKRLGYARMALGSAEDANDEKSIAKYKARIATLLKEREELNSKYPHGNCKEAKLITTKRPVAASLQLGTMKRQKTTAHSVSQEQKQTAVTALETERARSHTQSIGKEMIKETTTTTPAGYSTTQRDIQRTTMSVTTTESIKQRFEQQRAESRRLIMTSSITELLTHDVLWANTDGGKHFTEQPMRVKSVGSEWIDRMEKITDAIASMPSHSKHKRAFLFINSEEPAGEGVFWLRDGEVTNSSLFLTDCVRELAAKHAPNMPYREELDFKLYVQSPGVRAYAWTKLSMTQIADVLQHGHLDQSSVLEHECDDRQAFERGFKEGIGYALTIWLYHHRGSLVDRRVSTNIDQGKTHFGDRATQVARGLHVTSVDLVANRRMDSRQDSYEHKMLYAYGASSQQPRRPPHRWTEQRKLYQRPPRVIEKQHDVMLINITLWTSDHTQVKLSSIPILPASAGVVAMYRREEAASMESQRLTDHESVVLREQELVDMAGPLGHEHAKIVMQMMSAGISGGYHASDLNANRGSQAILRVNELNNMKRRHAECWQRLIASSDAYE